MLAAGRERWTAAWLERRAAARLAGEGAPRFAWPEVSGVPLNRLLMPALGAMTEEHCAYCDGYPVRGVAVPSIDHFRPKSRYEDLAFAWDNLFFACDCCQGSKRERFEEELLRPDDPEFRFERYFAYDPRTGDLAPSPSAAPDDQARALRTIELLALNEAGRPASRKRHMKRFRLIPPHERPFELPFFPYRFLLVDEPAPLGIPSTPPH